MIKNKYEKGQALILIVFTIMGLVGLTGLTIDGGRAYSDRRNAQNAADTAALAAALARTRGQNLQGFTAVAEQRAASNGYDNNGITNQVIVTTVTTPSGSCSDTGVDITVTIISTIPTSLARVLGRTEMTNQVESTARSCDVNVITKGDGGPLFAGAVYTTKTGSCGNGIKDKSLYINGSAHLQVWGGDMGSASTDGNCIYFKGGEAQLKKAESGSSCADVVTAATSGGTFNSMKGEDGCGQKYYNETMPTLPDDLGITCDQDATWNGSTMTPGNFSGTFPPSGVSYLQSGIYCVNGPFKLNANSKLSGNGVTIVMNSGNLHWNGSSEVKLSASTDGDYKGLLIYFPPSNSDDVDVNGDSNTKITGTILAQNSNCFFAGTGQLQKQVLQFICYTWGMDGNGQAEIVYDSNAFYSPIFTDVINPTISTWK